MDLKKLGGVLIGAFAGAAIAGSGVHLANNRPAPVPTEQMNIDAAAEKAALGAVKIATVKFITQMRETGIIKLDTGEGNVEQLLANRIATKDMIEREVTKMMTPRRLYDAYGYIGQISTAIEDGIQEEENADRLVRRSIQAIVMEIVDAAILQKQISGELAKHSAALWEDNNNAILLKLVQDIRDTVHLQAPSRVRNELLDTRDSAQLTKLIDHYVTDLARDIKSNLQSMSLPHGPAPAWASEIPKYVEMPNMKLDLFPAETWITPPPVTPPPTTTQEWITPPAVKAKPLGNGG